MTFAEVAARVLVIYTMATPVLGQLLYFRGRRVGWRMGLDDRDRMLNQVWGAGWQSRLCEHDNICPALEAAVERATQPTGKEGP